MDIKRQNFGKIGNQDIFLYEIKNDFGFTIKMTNYGGIITSIFAPDRNNTFENVILGYDTLDEYINDSSYIGCTVGRYANRISNGRFVIDGIHYELSKNSGLHQLHGGKNGFHKVIWDSEIVKEKDRCGVVLRYISQDLEEGFPGNLIATVRYLIDNTNSFLIEYEATTDKATHVSLTNHCYFTLNAGKKDILDHQLQIASDCITEVDSEGITSGKFIDVVDTAFDFREPKKIGKDIAKIKGGYDHNFVVRKDGSDVLRLAASVFDQDSGRTIDLVTTEPGIQFYTSNWFDGNTVGGGGVRFNKCQAFCLEAQHYPDSPNKPHFPSTLLMPCDIYKQVTVYKFGIK